MKQYQERIAVECLSLLFWDTYIPSNIRDRVYEIVERHGVWPGLAAGKLVLEAFNAGVKCGRSPR
ncbi:hypothetical protein KDK_24240 [Dictyobacter kobayashii]|uniref:Uncharacterized protein n=2 Tax=Dictyobacter kobayashii TaxID=2014872 RepID=A0A402AHW1_9CHLR|nr:hypothetical protein KDK_24240 [Dictyobacter kobayashii]